MNIRKKSWLLFVCVLLYFFFPVSGHAIDAEIKLQSLTVVSDDNYPPYIFRDSNGGIQGILVDEWKLWEKKTGIKVKLIAMDWSKAQEFLLRGNADVIDTMFFTEERAKQYDFAKPYATIDVPVFFHKNLGGIIDIASLQGFTIGVKAGDACIEVLKKEGITSFKEYNSYETIVNAAVDGEIKVFSIDKPPAFYYLYKMNFEDEFRYAFNLYTGKFHRAVIKGRTDILKTVEEGFALINKQEHNAIEKKWMGEPFTRPAYLLYVLFFFLFAGLIFLVLVAFNIALQKKVRLKTSEFQDLFNSIADLVYTQDMEGRFLSANPAMQRLFGYTMDEFIGHSVTDFMKPEFKSDFKNQYLEIIKKKGNHEGISCYFTKNKEKIYIEYNNSLVKPAVGKPYISGIGRDVTEKILSEKKLEKATSKLKKMATQDFLTGIANRMSFDEFITEAMNRCRRSKKAGNLLYLDLDGFKAVNDKYGHQMGDFLLQQVAKRLTSTLRETDFAARLGGDEFAVVTEALSDTIQPEKLAQKILSLIKKPYENEGESVIIGASIGISQFRPESIDSDIILENADRAMYRAKHGGKGRVCIYDPNLDE